MAKKKLLSEAQVRRFMGLAGMKSNIVSNHINESDWGYNRDELAEEADFPPEEEEEAAPAEMPPGLEAAGEEELVDDELPAEEAPGEDVEVAADDVAAALDALSALERVVRPMADAAGLEGAPEGGEELGELPPVEDEAEMAPVDDMPVADEEEEEEAPAPDVMQEETQELEEEVEEALAEVDLKLSKEEIINEVAKRVAQRILRAKKAQDELNEALGNK
jgi:hypothetical protein